MRVLETAFVWLTIAVPFILLASGGLIAASILRRPALRQEGLISLAILGGSIALDWALLAALPYLGLSFGPWGFPLVVFGLAHVGIFIVWNLFLGWREQRRLAGAVINSSRRGTGVLKALNGAVLLLIVYGFYVEPFYLTASPLSLQAPSEAVARPIRIVHLSDIHVERETRREREIVAKVKALQPDLILLTGDYLNLSYLTDPLAIRDARALLSQLQAPYGVYAVNGSVDGEFQLNALFDGLNIRILNDETARLDTGPDGLYLIGVSNRGYARDEGALKALAASVPREGYGVVLYHTPDLAPQAFGQAIDLYLAGHTHGGQVRLPLYGALITSSIHKKRYEQGLYTQGESHLYVSRGLGMEGSIAPRARFLAPPEIVVIDLIPTTR